LLVISILDLDYLLDVLLSLYTISSGEAVQELSGKAD
jgi:hypothetical protein